MNQEITCKKAIQLFESFCTNQKLYIGKDRKAKRELNNTDETTKKQHCAQMMQFIMDNCIGIVDYPYTKAN